MRPSLAKAVCGSRPARSWSSSSSAITGALRRAMRGFLPSHRHGPHTKFPTGPAEVEDRDSFGHWEADLLIFRREVGKANVTSLVERKSRFTFLLANEDKRSAAVIAGIADVLRGLPGDARRTITFDRGTEFAAGRRALDHEVEQLARAGVDPVDVLEGGQYWPLAHQAVELAQQRR